MTLRALSRPAQTALIALLALAPFARPARAQDTLLVLSNGFQDGLGNCNTRGWLAEDRTQRVFGHVSGNWTINSSVMSGLASSTANIQIGATAATSRLSVPMVIAITDSGNVVFADNSAIGPALYEVYAGGILRLFATFPSTAQIRPGARDPNTNELIVPTSQGIFRVPRAGGLPVLWGGASGNVATDTTLADANLTEVGQLAVDAAGVVYIADGFNNVVSKIRADLRVVRLAGIVGQPGSAGDGASGLLAHLSGPRGVTVDAGATTMWIGDEGNHAIRVVDLASGIITTATSTGVPAYLAMTPTGQVINRQPAQILRLDAGSTLTAIAGTTGVMTEFGSPAQLDLAINLRLLGPEGLAVGSDGSVYFACNRLVYKVSTAGIASSIAGTPVPVVMGSRAFWFGADMTSAADEVGNWVRDHGYGNGWSQRLASPTLAPYVAADDPTLQFDCVSQISGGSGIGFTSLNEYVVVDGLSAVTGAWVPLSGSGVATNGTPVTLTYENGHDVFHFTVHLADPSNAPRGPYTRLRIRMQSDRAASTEDGRDNQEMGGVLVDNLHYTTNGVDALVPVTFDDGTTGAWTVSAFNGAYDLGNAINPAGPYYTRDGKLPANTPALISSVDDTYDPTCAWTFRDATGLTPDDSYARITSPWMALQDPTRGALIDFAGRLNTIDQDIVLAVEVRTKRTGDTRPRAVSPTFARFNSGTSGSDPFSAFLSRTLSFPTDFDALNTGPVDSIQVVYQVEDISESGTTPPTNRPSALPYLDNLAIRQITPDTDHDGVADVRDACPNLSSVGEDADGDGCPDPTASLHHVRTWALADRPIHFALSQDGDPTITDGSDLVAVRQAFATWAQVPGASLAALEDPVTAQKAASAFDGVNLVTFEDPDLVFPPGVLAITTVTTFTHQDVYNDRIVLPGQIVDADMLLNPGVIWSTGTHLGDFDLQSVATHESGHFFGLSHSPVLKATMFYVIQPSQDARSLEGDDQAAIAAAYPGSSLNIDFGTIRGKITRGQDGTPVEGAVVTAMRLGGGGAPIDTAASDYTREDGSYALYRLTPGNYAVRVDPLDGSAQGLTASRVNDRVAAISQTNFLPEWWSQPETDRDDPTIKTAIAVSAGGTVPDINIVTNIDTIPPLITSVSPGDGAAGVGIDAVLTVQFSEAISIPSLQKAFVLHKVGDLTKVTGTGQLVGGNRLVFAPSTPLAFGTSYQLDIDTQLTDANGVPLAAPFSSGFATVPKPAVTITSIVPPAAPPGALITVFGSGFDAGASIKIVQFQAAGVPVTVIPSVLSSGSLIVRVPGGALTGPIQASFGAETSNGFNFTVLPPPPQASPSPVGGPISLSFTPTDLALSPDGLTVFVVGDGGLATIDLTQNTHTAVVRSASPARSIAMTPDGNRAVVTHPGSHSVDIVDTKPGSGTLGQPIASVVGLTGPGGVAVSADGRRAYVVDGQYEVKDIDLSAGPSQYTLIRTRTGSLPLNGAIAVDPTGAGLVLGRSGDSPIVLQETGDTTFAAFGGGRSPADGGIAISPDASQFLGAGPVAYGVLSWQDITTAVGVQPDFGATGTISVGGQPADVAYAHEGQSAFLVNSQFNSLDVINVDRQSSTYHTRVATVTTGQGPVAVATSNLSSIIAVANGGGRSVSIFTYGGASAGALSAALPPYAMPGDHVALTSSGNALVTGTQVDLGSGLLPALLAGGTGVSFTTPPLSQRATGATAQTPTGTRTLAVPLTVVDPIMSPAPKNTGTFPLSSFFCAGDNGQGYGLFSLMSPDGRVLVHSSSFTNGCNNLTFIRTSTDGPPAAFGTAPVVYSTPRSYYDLAFTPDSKQLWYTRSLSGGSRLDADPASPTFGQSIGGIEPVAAQSVAADPLGRYMICSGQDPSFNVLTVRSNPATGAVIDTVPGIGNATNMVFTPDGRYLVVSYDSGVNFEIRDASSLGTVLANTPSHPAGEFTNAQRLLITRDGRRLVALYFNNGFGVWNLDPTSGPLGAELSYIGLPGLGAATVVGDICQGPRPGTLLGASSTTNEMFLFDVNANGPVAITALPSPPTAIKHMSISPDLRRIWTFLDLPPIGGGGNTTFPVEMRMLSMSEATQLVVQSGDAQQAPVGSALPLPIVIKAVDGAGRPQEGVIVRFTQPAGLPQGSLDGAAVPFVDGTTDANGQTQVSWQPPAIANTYSLTVRGLGIPNTVNVTGTVQANDADIIPVVVAVGPTPGAVGINAGSALFIQFNQHMQHASVQSHFTLADQSGLPIAGTFSYANLDETMVFQPSAPMPYGQMLTMTLTHGSLDAESQAVVADNSVTFTVQTPPTLALASVTPPAGPAGVPVSLSGAGFSTQPSGNVVSFNGALAPVTSAGTVSLSTHVPLAASTGPVTVQVGTNISGPFSFTVLPPNTTPGTVIGDLPSGQGIRAVVVTPDGRHAYVTNPTTNDVTGLRVSDGSVIGRIPVGVDPIGLGIVPSGRRAYVANAGSNNVSVIDIDSTSATYNTVIRTIPVGQQPTGVGIAVQSTGVKVVVVNSGDGTLSIIDAQEGNATQDQVVGSTSTGAGTKGGSVVISQDGGIAWVGTDIGVVAVNLLDGTSTTLNTNSAVSSVAISPNGSVVIALLENCTLLVIGAQPGTTMFDQVVGSTSTGAGSKGGSVIISQDGALAYVSLPSGNTVLVFVIGTSTANGVSAKADTTRSVAPGPAVTLTLTATLTVGQNPGGLAVDPNGRFALVANAGSGTISIIGFPTSLPAIPCTFNFDPNTLNVKSMGKWVTGDITPPPPWLASQIVLSTLRLNGIVKVDLTAPSSINSTTNTLTVKFLRSDVVLALPEGSAIPVTLTGQIGTRVLTGSDVIAVKHGKVLSPIAGAYRQSGAPAPVNWEVPKGTESLPVAILYSLDHGATWAIGANHLTNNGTSTAWVTPRVTNDSVKVAVAVVESGDPANGDFQAVLAVSDYFVIAAGPAGVDDLPATLTFAPVVPNPSMAGANLRFGLPRAAGVQIQVFDVQGRRVKTLVDATRPAGWHTTHWDATDERGNAVGSGLYFLRMRAEGRTFEQRLTLLR
jgi:YVTN family beta-propeller protein